MCGGYYLSEKNVEKILLVTPKVKHEAENRLTFNFFISITYHRIILTGTRNDCFESVYIQNEGFCWIKTVV